MNLQPYVIRPAAPADLLQVVDLDHEAFSPYGTAESPTIIAARLAVFPAGFVVVERQGRVLGYGSSEKWQHNREPALDEDPSATHQPHGKIFCITAMAVQRAYWGQGIGSAILDQLIAIAQQHPCERVILETTHAQQFYLRRGFQVIKEREQADTILSVMHREL